MILTSIKPLWPEKKGFSLNRPDTGEDYIFVYFHTPITAQGREIPAGSAVMYDRHSEQRFRSDGCELVHDWFHARGNIPIYMKESGLEFGVYYPMADGRFITELISQMEMEWLGRDEGYEELIELLMQVLLRRIGREARRESAGIANSMLDMLIQARQRIHREYAREWSVEEMAALVPISPSRFYALYKEAFRISPKADLQNTRIMHAKNLLDTGHYSVRQTAELVGYAGSNPFIRVFKGVTGVTPTQYREENK